MKTMDIVQRERVRVRDVGGVFQFGLPVISNEDLPFEAVIVNINDDECHSEGEKGRKGEREGGGNV